MFCMFKADLNWLSESEVIISAGKFEKAEGWGNYSI